MGIVKSVKTFPYKGKAYNFSVSEAGKKEDIRKTLFDGAVHPEYIVYDNKSGFPKKASEILKGDVILDRDDKHWLICDVFAMDMDADFYEFTLEDGRTIKCSSGYRFLVTSPKKVDSKSISSGDVISDPSLSLLNKKIRSTDRS